MPLIFRLPDDIFYNILLDLYGENTKVPVELSLVCKRWRGSILNVPALWADITFNHPPPYDTQALQLHRSKASPLIITIRAYRTYGMGIPATVAIIKLLRPHVHRFRSLEIKSLKGKGLRTFFDELGKLEAPLLGRILVSELVDAKRWTQKPFGDHAPRLQVLHLACGGRKNWHPPLLCNLTSLTLGLDTTSPQPTITVFEILITLSKTPKLEQLVIKNTAQIGLPWMSAQVPLNELSRIDLIDAFVTHPRTIDWRHLVIRQIIAPKVRRLTSPNVIPSPTLLDFTQCQYFPLAGLHELFICPTNWDYPPQEWNITKHQILLVLQVFQQLRRLTLPSDMLDEAVFRCLSTQFSALEKLVVHNPAPPFDALRRMVCARIEDFTLAPLLSMRLDVIPGTKNEMLEKEDVKWLMKHVPNF